MTAQEQNFVKKLLQWNDLDNNRQMPWKGEKDPYKIWLSEIILQQTRVHQGLDYYNRFVANFPTIKLLAKAPETNVFKLWEGLGYYTRCKNLIATAKYITDELDGKFPDNYADILLLKGIGPYTAAAIGSFAFNLPYAVVDGNVFRVLSRYFGIAKAIDSNDGKQFFTLLANKLLDKKQPGKYNQALMDFGAVICKPQLPDCNNCMFKTNCTALAESNVNQLPVSWRRSGPRGRPGDCWGLPRRRGAGREASARDWRRRPGTRKSWRGASGRARSRPRTGESARRSSRW